METTRPVQETAPGRLEWRKGGGCLTLFGLPFLAAGVFLTLIGLGLIALENAEEVPAWGWPVMVLMGAVFIAAGGAMVFGRGVTVIERERGIISEQWGLLVPMRSRETSLTEFSAVIIEYVRGDSDSPDRYPVKLEQSGDGKDLTLISPTDYADALRQARRVAGALRFPLKDRTSDHETVLGAGALEMSFRDRIQRQPAEGAAARRPPAMKSGLEESGGAVQITIPGQRRGRLLLVQAGLTAAVFGIAALVISGFFRKTDTPEGVRWLFLGFVGLIFAVSLIGGFVSLVRGRGHRTIVSADKGGITIEERSGGRSRSTRIPADAILDLDYGTKGSAVEAADVSVKRMSRGGGSRGGSSPRVGGASPLAERLRFLVRSKGVTVKSTSGLHTFGGGLPDEEIRYIHALLTKALAG